MSAIAPKTFKSTDAGAPPCDGQVGSLIELLSSCLVVRKAFSAVSGASFLDRTTECRLAGGTAVTPFQTPGTSDEFYIGMCVPFERIGFTLSTPGIGGSYTWQYWNGSAWTTFSPTDGTSGFTGSGSVSWLISSLTGWATHAVNSSTIYWVRVLMASTPSTNPLIGSLTVTGWSEAYTGTNLRSYQMGGGNQFFLDVDDTGPGAGTTKEARIRGYETMTAVATGTNPFPTVAQETNGLIARKSAATGATTRTWELVADDRSIWLTDIPGDASNYYTGFGYGDFDSDVASDPYRTFIIGRPSTSENSTVGASTTVNRISMYDCDYNGNAIGVATSGKYLARNYAGVAGAVPFGTMHTLPTFKMRVGATQAMGNGIITYPNEINGGVFATRMWIFEGASGTKIRGRLRGFWMWGHVATAVADLTPFTGTGDLSSRTFLLLQPMPPVNSDLGALLLETSDTWATN